MITDCCCRFLITLSLQGRLLCTSFFLSMQRRATNALQLLDPSTASDLGNVAYLHARSQNSIALSRRLQQQGT
ncbi:MAG TPA: hypothetical protein VEI57_17625 [Nitrospirota bacterium]|nr:hypothetical protein [Nitrospirota bacterium]